MQTTQKKKKSRHIFRKIILALLLLVILGIAGLVGYTKLRAEYTTVYQGYTAMIGSITNAMSYSGTLQLVDSKLYAANGSATVRQVYAAEGDKVRKGDRLLRLSNGQSIEADFDGTINQLYVEKGDEVNAGASLLQLADFSHMQVSVRIDEYDINDVAVGMACRVTTTATGKTFETKLDSINYISQSQGSVAYYTATAHVDVSEGVYPGMQITLTIPKEEANNVVILKADALSFDETNQAYVMVSAEENEYVKREVEVGVSNGNYTEIKAGVSDGETVYAEVKAKNSMSEIQQWMWTNMGQTQVMPGNRNNWNGGGSGGNWNPGGGGMSRPGGN